MIADAMLHDAYSRAVVGVASALAPTVVSLAVRTSRRGGQGSGFVVTPDGYALTNHHVIEKATEVKALLADGRSVRARVIGSDPATDLALVRLAAGSLEYVELEGGVSATPGQLAIAIGSPLGFDATVSAGIVSATDRRLGGMRRAPIENLIQHTAPLNPGNSGGPLADSKGRILGVNTAIIYRSQGIGFAVPAETAVGHRRTPRTRPCPALRPRHWCARQTHCPEPSAPPRRRAKGRRRDSLDLEAQPGAGGRPSQR